MRNWVIATAASLAMIAIALICVGFYQDNQVVETKIKHTVKSGETLNGIALKYYRNNKPGYISQRDYAMMVRVENNKLYNLERQLQIGDEVIVPVYQAKTGDK